MDEEMKGFWTWFIALVAAAAVSLVGALIGKTVVGYILFGLGLAGVVGVFVFCFIKKTYFKADRLKPLILGLAVSLMLASSVILLVRYGSRATAMTGSNNSLFSSLGGTGTARSLYGSSFGSNGGSFSGNGGNFTGRFSNGDSGTGTNGSSSRGTNSTGSSSFGSSTARTAATRFIIYIVLGWVLLAAGTITLLVALIRFLRKKVTYEGYRWKVLVLGVLVGAFVSSAFTLTVLPTVSRSRGNFPTQFGGTNGQGFSGTLLPGQNGTPGAAGAFVTTEPTGTATPTPIPTLGTALLTATVVAGTPEPTAAPTSSGFDTLVVCLSADYPYGLNVREQPNDTARIVGLIPSAGCFTLDGQSAAFPGWYLMAPGQNGFGGKVIYVDDSKVQLWVNVTHSDASQANLDSLPVVEVAK